jgi:hypothetical protein
MEWPPRVAEIVEALYRQHIDLATESDDSRRVLARLIAEQCCFEFGSAWGVKASTPHNPQGQSTLAFNGPEGLVGWRWQDNDGSVTGIKHAPIPHPPMQSFAGQFFMPVTPVDHLRVGTTSGGPAEPLPPSPPSLSPPPSLSDIAARIDRLEAQLARVEQLVTALAGMADALKREGWPEYKGTYGITLKRVDPRGPV